VSRVVDAEPFGPYLILEALGIGGMAHVHRAELALPNGETKIVALKRLLPEVGSQTSFIRRFVDEARIGQRLDHPNIVKTNRVGNINGWHFIELEYVPGPTLAQLFLRSVTPPVPIALRIFSQVSRALAYAHGLRDELGQPLRLIHRDIAPSNIMVSESGSTKLIDFGAAKSSTSHVRTQVGSIIGKLGYIAPEYLRGKLDARVDIFSLGVVAYELLTQRRLFDVQDMETAEQLRKQPIAPPSTINPEVPAALDAIILRALARDPNQRWQGALDLYTALSSLEQQPSFAATDADVANWLGLETSVASTENLWERTIELEIDLDEAFSRVFCA
jgi:serine/threonine protein kinase